MILANDGNMVRSNAPALNYDLPDATAYTGTYITELEFDSTIFKDEVLQQTEANPFPADELLAVADAIREIAQLKDSLAEAKAELESERQTQSQGDPALEAAKARYEMAQATWQRTQALQEKGVISDEDFASARKTYQEAEASWGLAQKLVEDRQKTSATISDTIREITVKLDQAEKRSELNHPLRAAFETAKTSGFFDPQYFPNVRGITTVADHEGARAAIEPLTTEVFLRQVAAGEKLNIYRTLSGEFRYNFIAVSDSGAALLLIEEYRLSSFHGDYGVGRTLKTFTLLPGERTTISLQTYKRRTEDAQRASSILDSYSTESANDFESSVQREQSNKSNVAKSFAYHAEAEASAEWGWGSAKVSGGVSGSSRSSRQQFSKNVFNATSKHAARASAQRDVEVNTSYEVRTEEGQETSVKREIANTNISRTLNFVFRQLNQEFITVLHLVDVRIGFYNGYPPASREVPLHELDSLLEEVVVEGQRDMVERAIIGEVRSMVADQQFEDHGDFIQPVPGEETFKETANRYFVNSYFTSTYQDDSGWRCVTVTSKDGLNVRSGAGIRFAEVEALTPGTQLEADFGDRQAADGHDWVQVRSGDVTGWASAQFLELCDPADATSQNTSGRVIRVPGVILGVNKYVMRTDSVFVDSILGEGDALEPVALRSKELDNDLRQIEIEKYRLLEKLLLDLNAEQKAALAVQLLASNGAGQ